MCARGAEYSKNLHPLTVCCAVDLGVNFALFVLSCTNAGCVLVEKNTLRQKRKRPKTCLAYQMAMRWNLEQTVMTPWRARVS